MASVSIIYSRKCKKTMDAVTWIDDDWIEGNPPILGANDTINLAWVTCL